jgi:hypothetical protein
MRRLWTDSRAFHPLASLHAQVVVMEEIDQEDVRVYLPMHEENGFTERLQAQHYAEVMANESGWEFIN